MAEIKTKPTSQSVEAFLGTISDSKKREDSFAILELMKSITGEEPKMWGESMIGFGSYNYKYASGQQGTIFLTGFSPRKQNLTIYLIPGFERYEGLLQKLGKHKTSKACLYIKKLEDIDVNILKELIEKSIEAMKNN